MNEGLKMIRQKRRSMELTETQMANKLGVSRTSYGRYERGDRSFGVDTLRNTFEILNFNSNEIVKFFELIVPESKQKLEKV